MSSVAAAAASTATAAGESEAGRSPDGYARTDGSVGPPASPGSGSLARLRGSTTSFELGGLPDPPSAQAPPEDEESQTTYGSWQEEAPRPVDLARAVSFVAPSSVHSVHLSHLKPQELRTISRLRFTTHDLEEAPPPPPRPRNAIVRAFRWWRSWAVPGMGMFVEAWMIFAIGNILPLLAINYPYCFGRTQPASCNKSAADAVTYIEVCGIILGMLVLGFFADIIGRKWGSRLTATIMLVGAALLTGSAGNDGQFLAMFLTSLFLLGTGVGGEYPVASSSAAERAEGSRTMRRRRGETVLLVFSQQGWGNFANTLAILLLLAVQGATGAVVTSLQAEVAWRVQFGIGTLICAALAAYRWTYLQESKVWKAERHDVAEQLAQKGIRSHHSPHEYKLVFRFYWPRLMAVCLTWALSNFSFYGHKLYQSAFIAAIAGPDATLFTRYQYTLLNSGIALVGYYFAAALVDRRWYGRVRMQAVGFLMLFLLFILIAALYPTLINNTGAFQFLYLFSSFWNQLGPNCTTFLIASEVYPTAVRSFFHGMSAAAGKVGALAAAALFPQISARAAFYASAGAGALGLLVTLAFLPDTSGLDLHEIDRMNRYMLAGQLSNYHGLAVCPVYLSWYERWRGYGDSYLPERDMVHKHLQRHPHIEQPPPSVQSWHSRRDRSRQSSHAASQWSAGPSRAS
ncbi:hypothetical protein ABPG77_009681 [Micractinium sp. CCAP 211/92]